MKSTRTRSMVMVVVIAAVLGGITLLTTERTQAASPQRMKVKLYDSGKVVGEWASDGSVRVEDGTLTFTVRDGVRSREVRVHGTFSAEEID